MTRSAAVEQPRSRRCSTPPSWFVGAPGNTKLQVLLIDDEIEQLLPLADALRRAGMLPTIATSDEEALFYVRISPPDVVVLDAEMADRSLLVGIPALAAELPLVLMISAPTNDPRIAAMLAIAGVACVEKPVHAWRLVELLSDAHRAATTANRT